MNQADPINTIDLKNPMDSAEPMGQVNSANLVNPVNQKCWFFYFLTSQDVLPSRNLTQGPEGKYTYIYNDNI